MVHAPAVVKLMIQRDVDHLRRGRDRAARGLQRTGQIDPVEAQDRRPPRRSPARPPAPGTSRARRRATDGRSGNTAPHFRSVTTRARSASASATRLAQACSPREPRPIRITGCFALPQHRHRLRDLLRRSGRRHIRHEPGNIDRRQRIRQRRFLHAGVEVDIDRAHRRRLRQPAGTQHRLARRFGRGRLIVPFGIVADQRALIARGVDPVDPGPALRRIHRSGRAEHQHRHPVAPGVEDRHRRVHQPDIGMHRRRHRPARSPWHSRARSPRRAPRAGTAASAAAHCPDGSPGCRGSRDSWRRG